MTASTLELDDRAVQRMLQGVSLAAFDATAAWREAEQYMRVRTDSMFAHIHSVQTGGSWRGVTWKPLAPQYTRKTDGVTVPAWGGVPRLRGGGLVLGRKRPSGVRVAAGDALMQDTMTMRARAALTIRRDRHQMQLGPQGVRYAARQNALRPFLFFEIPQDARAIGKTFARHIATGARTGTLPKVTQTPIWEQYG